MLDTSVSSSQTATAVRSHTPTWAAYAACAWCAAYVLPHLYLALGGTAILPTFNPAVAGVPQLRQINWIASLVLAAAAVLPLAFVQPWGRRIPRWMLLSAAWLGCVVPAAHGLYGIVDRANIIAGLTPLDARAFTLPQDSWVLWDLLVYEPWFLIAGILFGLSGWYFPSTPRDRRVWTAFCTLGALAMLGTALLHVKVG